MSCSVLDEEEFRRCARLFLQQSQRLRDGWSWQDVPGSDEGFLKKTTVKSLASTSRSHDHPIGAARHLEAELEEQQGAPALPADPERTTGEDDVLQLDPERTTGEDDVLQLDPERTTVMQMEYHIVFSCSYQTPVLYFRGFTLEGRSLSLEEVWSCVHPNFRRHLEESRLNAISQQEHPLLFQPFFVLHPCRTKEFMKPLLQTKEEELRSCNYVLSWISVVGPVVGLEVSIKYCTDSTDRHDDGKKEELILK